MVCVSQDYKSEKISELSVSTDSQDKNLSQK